VVPQGRREQRIERSSDRIEASLKDFRHLISVQPRAGQHGPVDTAQPGGGYGQRRFPQRHDDGGIPPATSRPHERRKARAASVPSIPAARTRFRSLISRSNGISARPTDSGSPDIGKARRRCLQGLPGTLRPMVQPGAEPALLLRP
jgi:hypothetical protein